MNKLGLLLIALAATASSPALAQSGNLSLMPTAAWAQPISDGEMSKLRGGFDGIAFSVFFNGTIDSLGNATGQLFSSGTPNTNAPPPNVTTSDGTVHISSLVGNFQGANGIFQIAQVPGNFNVVNNQLFVQVAIFNVLNPTLIPNLATLLGPPH